MRMTSTPNTASTLRSKRVREYHLFRACRPSWVLVVVIERYKSNGVARHNQQPNEGKKDDGYHQAAPEKPLTIGCVRMLGGLVFRKRMVGIVGLLECLALIKLGRT